MDVGRGAIKPYGISWQYFAGAARGRGVTPGPGVQQFGGGGPVRGPQQPWGHYNHQLGLHTQANASYGGGPRLGLQQPGGPGSRGPGLGMPGPRFQPPMGPCFQPPLGPCFQLPVGPGGLFIREPGLWLQQSLGPGSRAPEIKHHSGFYNGHAGMGPQLVGIPCNAAGSGPGPQQPGGPYSQGMGMPPGYISSQNKNQGYKSGGPGQGWDQSPAGTSRSTECTPAGMSRSRNHTPVSTGRSRDRSPAGKSRDRSPAGKSRSRDRSPAGKSRRRDRSPAGTSRKRDRSPAGTSRRRDRSPAGTSRKRDRSPAGTSRRRDRSPAGMSRGRSPAGTSRRRDTKGTSGSLIPVKEYKEEIKGQLFETKRTKLSLQRLRSLKVEPFPPHCSVKTIQEALQDTFGKFGEITSIQVNGKNEERSAMVFYKFVRDRDSALSGTQGTSLFNMNISVTVWPYKKNQSYTVEIESGFFAEEGSGTLYISNLSPNVFRADLLRSFISFGGIVYAEVQRLPGPYNYGVVQFTDDASVNKAISEMNGMFLSRGMLKEKFGDSFSSNCIFVYRLSKTSFTEESLARHFGQFGAVKKVLFDPSSGRALVFFKDNSSAEKAIHEIREKSADNLLRGDYANREFVERYCRSIKVRGQNRKGFVLRLGEPSIHGAKVLAKENQILVDNSEEEQQKYILTGAGELKEEADMLAEASEEESDMLAEVSENMKVLDEVGEEQEEVSPLLDCSEKMESSSDSGEEAAEPLPEVDEKSVPAFAGVVKKNTHSVRNRAFLIPVKGHRKKSK